MNKLVYISIVIIIEGFDSVLNTNH